MAQLCRYLRQIFYDSSHSVASLLLAYDGVVTDEMRRLASSPDIYDNHVSFYRLRLWSGLLKQVLLQIAELRLAHEKCTIKIIHLPRNVCQLAQYVCFLMVNSH